MAKAIWEGTVLAESDKTIVVEGNHYFPIDSIKREHLKPSELTSVCGWKGTASYYDIDVGGKINKNAAWFYPQPKEAVAQILDHVAFWNGVEVQA